METSPTTLLLHLAKNKRYTQTPKTPKHPKNATHLENAKQTSKKSQL
jgi:hypothetical protein